MRDPADLVILAEDGEVEERLLGRQEPEVVGGEAVERGALAVVPVLRRHHGRAELLGDDGQVVVGEAVAGGLAADAQEDRAGGVGVVVQELEVALLEFAVVLRACRSWITRTESRQMRVGAFWTYGKTPRVVGREGGLTVGEKWSRRWFIQCASRVRYLLGAARSSSPAVPWRWLNPSGSALRTRRRRKEAPRR